MNRARRRAALAATAAAILLALTGCGTYAGTNNDGTLGGMSSHGAGLVHLPDGRAVMCVAFGQGGISCDWDRAK